MTVPTCNLLLINYVLNLDLFLLSGFVTRFNNYVSRLQHDLKTEDFSSMSAPLLYEMFKSKSGFPLHLAVRHHREDVVFLFLIEFNSQVKQKHCLFTR